MIPPRRSDGPDPISPPHRFGRWLVYLAAGMLFMVGLVWVTLDTVRKAPAREVTTDLGPYGLVTIRFDTDPYPALPSGTVILRFLPMDSRQRPVSLDSVRFEYGREDSDQPVGSDHASPMSDGSGMFVGRAQFPYVGNWWIRLNLSKGSEQASVRFTFYVEPAQ